ncbi:MAG: sensor histidine kinase [Pseudomonadales bacterium]
MTESIPHSKPQYVMQQSVAHKRRTSFRRQLFLIFAACGFGVALAAAIAYAYSTSQYIRELYLNQALQATEHFAELSELALLYDSGENAEDAATSTLSFPSIKFVSLINSEGTVLLDKGKWRGKPIKFDNQRPRTPEAELIDEKDNAWHFWAPVYTQSAKAQADDGVILSGSDQQEYIGFVYVVQDKREFLNSQYESFRQNAIIGLLCAAVFIVMLHFAINRLLAPMTRLVEVMDRARQGDTAARATPEGSVELVNMAETYNSVIANLADRDMRLMQQKDELESEVALRTQELVQARDEAVDASRHKSEFLSNISHELRTPLQAILGYSDIMHEGLEDEGLEDLCKDVERITVNANHLLNLINSILDLSKIEAGRIDVNLTHVKISNVVQQAQETILPLMQKNANQLILDVEESDSLIEIDETKLLQILLNLLSNAGKFTQMGEVTVSARQRDEELNIEVTDTGIGMSRQHLNMIFDPFRQIDGSATREFQGTGLGLSITQRFCEVMGGYISVTSEPGRGSTFSVRFPLPIRASDSKARPVDVGR